MLLILRAVASSVSAVGLAFIERTRTSGAVVSIFGFFLSGLTGLGEAASGAGALPTAFLAFARAFCLSRLALRTAACAFYKRNLETRIAKRN